MNEIYYLIYGFIAGVWLEATIKGNPNEKENKKIREIYEKIRKRVSKLPKKCPLCGGSIKHIPAGISKRTGRPYKEFWVCENPECSFTTNKRGGQFIWSWDKNQNQKSRTSEEKTKTKKSETKKEEIEDTDEIDVSKIPF